MPDTAPISPQAAALRARYREAPAPVLWNEVVSSLLAHRSVRHFRPDPLPDGALEAAVAAASSAATSSNLQTWSVIAVQDPGRRAQLAELAGAQGFIRQAPLLLVWLADLSRLDRLAEWRGDSVEGPHYLELLLVATIDAALAAQNAVVALESLGLGTVYIGAMRNKPEAVAEALGLPPHVFAAFGLSVGWPDPDVPAAVKPRLPPSVVLHHEQYQATSLEAMEGYESRMGAFQSEQRMPPEPWISRCLNRVRGVKSLAGRDRMRAALAALGFELR